MLRSKVIVEGEQKTSSDRRDSARYNLHLHNEAARAEEEVHPPAPALREKTFKRRLSLARKWNDGHRVDTQGASRPPKAAKRPDSMASSSSNVVGVHYRVGKKIGEGSFGVIFEGTNLLNNNQVAIKFVGVAENPYPAVEADS